MAEKLATHVLLTIEGPCDALEIMVSRKKVKAVLTISIESIFESGPSETKFSCNVEEFGIIDG